MQKIIFSSFEEDYYKRIWGTVHRHDYCEDLANNLISQYGKCRILDIGTGCGFLVKKLREKGCDAWGLEISNYALENTCAPGYVLKGNVRKIPFKDFWFDLIHSQGLWEYIPDDEVDNAFKECLRVGKKQHHNFDALEQWNPPEHKKINIKPRAWWDAKKIGIGFDFSEILIACPMHENKEYSFQRYIDSVKKITYPNDLLVVENSPTLDFYNRYKNQIPIIHQEDTSTRGWLESMNQCVATIQKKFLEGNYLYWFSTASDIIYPPDILDLMVKWGNGGDWIAHAFPRKDDPTQFDIGISCSLLSRKIMQDFDFGKAEAESYDAFLWEQVRPQGDKYKTVEMWGFTKLIHLDK